MNYNWLPLSKVKKYERLAAERGVSFVARSKSGFLAQYKKAGGDWRKLSEHWQRKRNAFVARHLAQMKLNGRPFFEKSGKYAGTPTRQHLALIMWAYSPRVNGEEDEADGCIFCGRTCTFYDGFCSLDCLMGN